MTGSGCSQPGRTRETHSEVRRSAQQTLETAARSQRLQAGRRWPACEGVVGSRLWPPSARLAGGATPNNDGEGATTGPDCICAPDLCNAYCESGRATALRVEEQERKRVVMLAADQWHTGDALAYGRGEAGQRRAHGCAKG